MRFPTYIPRKLSLQHSPFQTHTSTAPYFYSALLLYPPKAISAAQRCPNPYFYSPQLLYPSKAVSLLHSPFQNLTSVALYFYSPC